MDDLNAQIDTHQQKLQNITTEANKLDEAINKINSAHNFAMKKSDKAHKNLDKAKDKNHHDESNN